MQETGHVKALESLLNTQTSKDYWQQFETGKLLPTLCGFFNPAFYVDHYTAQNGGNCFWAKDRTEHCEEGFPVQTRLINITHIAGYTDDMVIAAIAKKDFESIRTMEYNSYALSRSILSDLRKLELNVFEYSHHSKIGDERFLHYTILLPRIKLEGDPAKPTQVNDYEGAVTLLAYMLHKGYLTANDIPNISVTTELQALRAPFDRTMLKLAQSTQSQNKIRQCFGEPLLPTTAVDRYVNQNPDKGGIVQT